MRYLLTLLLTLFFAAPGVLHAAMDSYCSAPPYVTRTVAPNIMILMDNSNDMMDSAYPEDYDSSKDYIGYFHPTGCYSYSSNKFEELLNTSGSPSRSYLATETCPAAAPFRGKLMNWATMSRFDVLQKVLIGGNSASKQGNAHTLVSISGASWPDRSDTTSGCVFQVNNGNLTITETVPNACSLLDSPPVPIAMESSDVLPGDVGEVAPRSLELLLSDYAQAVSDGAKGAFASASDFWDNLELVPSAWAGACSSITVGSLNGTVGSPFSLTLTLPENAANKTATWTTTTMPAWLGSPTYSKYNNKLTNGVATWTGTPTAAGSFPFEVSVTSTSCTGTSTISGNVVISPEDLKINHVSPLPDGNLDNPYTLELHGQGGIGALSWMAAGLPAGLSIGTATVGSVTNYYISGTPTVAGTSTVTLTLSDSSGDSLTQDFELSIVEGLTVTTNSLPGGQEGEPYATTLSAQGGTPAYTWSIVAGSLPSGVSMNSSGVFSGTIAAGAAGSYPITVQLQDSVGDVTTADFTIEVVTALGHVEIFSTSPLPTAYKGVFYSYQIVATGGCEPYTWSVSSGSLPSWMSLSATGVLSGTPDNNNDITYADFDISVEGCGGWVDTVTFSITSLKKAPGATNRSASYTVKVVLEEEVFQDSNGNDIWDQGEFIDDDSDGLFEPADGEVRFEDDNGNGVWDGKVGIFHKFWDANNPRARWGMTKFKNQGVSTIVEANSCIPVTNASSFYTAIQNATPSDSSPLADGLYGVINYYGFDNPYGLGYSGCTNSDPIDEVPCRKNYVLVISSGTDVSGTDFSATADCTASDPLEQNACYGYTTDLRDPDSAGTQNVHTFIVNTMGTSNNTELEAAALAGGGGYYQAASGSDLETALIQALEDILAQAASGTAVSVLTTSSRGIGSMIQAYFLPVKQEGEREVSWVGYTQNLWIDPQDNLREDSPTVDHELELDNDKVVRFFFDESVNESKAALFETDADGTGGDLGTCSDYDLVTFSDISYNWEGGEALALTDPSDRTIFTSKKLLRVDSSDATTATTFSPTLFTTGMDSDLVNALNAGAGAFTANEIIGYIRGECLETGVSGDSACGATPNGTFRDRRVGVSGGDVNGNVWKLGDVISSTPKVLSGTPANTYHIDYGDNTYYQYVSSDTYKHRSSIAFVGANDGMLHAFRVGYLVDSGLAEGVKAKFQNAYGVTAAATATDKLGEEVWGYIPYNALPYLQYLADPDYGSCHIYYNDLSVRLVDASLGCDTAVDASCDDPGEARKAGSWKTVLIGGMRFGGACDGGSPTPPLAGTGYSSYYAIDITDPESPVPMWEFSHADMGFATTFPSIIRTGGKTTNGNWYLAIGSGSTDQPKSRIDLTQDIGRSGTGYVFLLDLKTGALAKKISLHDGNADVDDNHIVGDILAIDKDKDYVSEKIYFGTSYDDGSGTWKGKLFAIDIPDQDLTAAWAPNVVSLFEDAYPFTASPDATRDSVGTTWVYAGSGKYFSDLDESDTSDQIFFGLKDLSTITYPLVATDLDDQSAVTTTGTVTGTTSVCLYDSADNDFSMQDLVTSVSGTEAAASDTGWRLTLSGGERMITRPLAVGGLVDFLTYKPSSDPCSYGGNSYLYAVGYTSGVAPPSVAIRAPDTTNGATEGTVTVNRGILLGPGAPPTGEAIIIPPPKEGQEQLKKKIQIATGVIVEAENTPVLSVISKVIHWLKK
ncbi:putative Ig domain-containing protein [uncultured Desulfuromonas sp.]|uniref:putative Ig domain-containing protein n=1 Tax=uncultured Desulfuromonas sp. TaxID=181013 RepID=UPI002603D0F5|nr:putative Ig domain-containing protein [uncultured Desulfuromonas sp.]